MSQKPRVHIIGGGFSGLMTAFFCLEKGCEIVVSEAEHWGGILDSETSPWGLIEHAANGFLRTALLSEVARAIDIQLLAPLPGAKQRWIANEKPETRPVSWPTIARAVTGYGLAKLAGTSHPRPQELLSDWGERVLGRTTAERVLRPALQGVYGLDSTQLSASLVLNPLRAPGRAKRQGFTAPRLGMQEWNVKMRNFLRPRGVRLMEERIVSWPDADHVVLAVSSAAKAALLASRFPEAAALFAQVQTVPMISVSSFWEKSAADLTGFGVLFNRTKGWKPSGVLFNEQIFEGRGPNRSERYFFAGAESAALSDLEIMQQVDETRGRLEWKNERLGYVIKRWPSALPHYSLAHEKILDQLPAMPRGVHLTGNDMGEIGLTGLAERAQRIALVIGGSK